MISQTLDFVLAILKIQKEEEDNYVEISFDSL